MKVNLSRLTTLCTVLVGLAAGVVQLPLQAGQSALEVAAAWVRPTIGQSKTTAAYFVLRNAGESDDALVAVEVAGAGHSSLHETVIAGDVATMQPLERVAIPPGAVVTFEPGGKHVMVMGLSAPLKAGETVPLILHFASGASIKVEAVVTMKAPDAPDF